jgi:hypothetical protein
MSVLSNYTASPTRVLGLYRFLLQHSEGREKKSVLMRSFMPPVTTNESAGEPRKILAETITAGESLGLWEQADGDLVLRKGPTNGQVEAGAAEGPTEETVTSTRLWTIVSNALWTGNDDNDDLGYATAWFLAQDPTRGGWTQSRVSEQIKDTQWSDRTGISESGKYTCFRDWVTYLGLGWHLPGSSGRELLPDPTAHIRNRLADILDEPGQEMVFPTFVEHLANLCPALDGGRYRLAVEGDQVERPENHLSATTTVALQRLEDEHTLELVSKADAPSHLVLETDGKRRQISHVVWRSRDQ